jgi:hypothetical protein
MVLCSVVQVMRVCCFEPINSTEHLITNPNDKHQFYIVSVIQLIVQTHNSSFKPPVTNSNNEQLILTVVERLATQIIRNCSEVKFVLVVEHVMFNQLKIYLCTHLFHCLKVAASSSFDMSAIVFSMSYASAISCMSPYSIPLCTILT